jgi:uncharacterized protein (DUF58 family)
VDATTPSLDTPQRGLISPVDLAQLASLSVRARTIIEGAIAGLHRTLHVGTSLEFTEHKEYAPGDDVRRIDWKAVGRADRYVIKRFENETELRVTFLIDASASMGYHRTTVSKLTYATYLAAAVAYLLGQQGDAAGLWTLCGDPPLRLPPSARPGQIREILQALENLKPNGSTDAASALAHLGETAEKRSLFLLFSDLLDVEELNEANSRVFQGEFAMRLRQLRARGHDVVLFHVLDPDEVTLPFDDLVFFEGVEPNDQRTLLCEARDLTRAFARESAAFQERWRQTCLESQVEYRFARTDLPPAAILREFLQARQKGGR